MPPSSTSAATPSLRRIAADPDAHANAVIFIRVLAETTAAVLGMNAVSDGRNVVLSPLATRYADLLRARGYEPVPVDLSELLAGRNP